MRIEEVRKLNLDPRAAIAAAKASVAIMDRFHLEFGCDRWDQPALVACQGCEVVGILQYEINDDREILSVDLAWVDPDYPAALHMLAAKVRRIARFKHVRCIEFSHNHGNSEMERLCRIVGAKPLTHRYRVTL